MVEMERLPFEIIREILSRLPVKSLLRFRCVSKDWRSLISDPFFISQHLRRSSEKNPSVCLTDGPLFTITFDGSSTATRVDIPFKGLVDEVEIVGSCNGLLCLFPSERLSDWFGLISPIYLWNPAIREYKRLPDAPVGAPRMIGVTNTVLGFGYDHINNEYKVVRIVYFSESGMDNLIFKSDVTVYSLGTGKWKKLGNVPFDIRNTDTSSRAVVNGSIHWMATREINSEMSNLIVSFDVRNEVFREIQLPNCVEAKPNGCVRALGGFLSLIECIPGGNVEIWVMKDYGVNGSWTKQFTIELLYGYGFEDSREVFPKEILRSGEILIEKNNKNLVLYNPESKGERELEINGLPDAFESFLFMESLVPLSDGSRY
ncbi:F-box/kelch-repeat protein At3g06240-like [Telopea speciosissima]|uniref:F-box/kelch-repeat protein At3g06240-like n=1 Tax=Telopea speciosissima TaxID=54955 RepID=UPI001CC37C2D|nr:F-box/kelch-repeat protein At3g06240-like [Telopea speciosissima]